MLKLPTFKNRKLFIQAFTHRSYLNEAKERIESNERLEFLGDSILAFVVSNSLYNKYNGFNEGILTNLRSLLVNTKSLAQIAKEFEFGKLLRLSKGEEEAKGRQNQNILADCFEAFIGALFIDQGIEKVRIFLEDSLLLKAKKIVEKKSFKDAKSLLQEHVQSQKKNAPLYKVLGETGPAHDRTFTIGVYSESVLLGRGDGKSKQEAEENAAKQAIEKIG